MKFYYALLVATALIAVVAARQFDEKELPKPDPRCPEIDHPSHPVHLPNDEDCKKFYKCHMGLAIPQDCPRGLKWDAIKDRCEELVGGRCPSPNINLLPVNNTKCPEKDETYNPVHYPHPFDCNLFYKCSNGVGVLHKCPEGLHWSAAANRCEYPHLAGCRTV